MSRIRWTTRERAGWRTRPPAGIVASTVISRVRRTNPDDGDQKISPRSTVVCRTGMGTVSPWGTVSTATLRDSRRRRTIARPATAVSGSRESSRSFPFQTSPARSAATRQRRQEIAGGARQIGHFGDLVGQERTGGLDVGARWPQQATVPATEQSVRVGDDLGVAGSPAEREGIVPALQRDAPGGVACPDAPDAVAVGRRGDRPACGLGLDFAVRRSRRSGRSAAGRRCRPVERTPAPRIPAGGASAARRGPGAAGGGHPSAMNGYR